MKKVLVSLPDNVNAIIERESMGKLGESKSQVVRTLVIAHPMELGYIGKTQRRKNVKQEKNQVDEINILDDMLSALVEVLEEKGLISQEEWERKIKEKLRRKASLKSFNEL